MSSGLSFLLSILGLNSLIEEVYLFLSESFFAPKDNFLVNNGFVSDFGAVSLNLLNSGASTHRSLGM
jgi:hypothetical protein